jgi:hypothetical protein
MRITANLVGAHVSIIAGLFSFLFVKCVWVYRHDPLRICPIRVEKEHGAQFVHVKSG